MSKEIYKEYLCEWVDAVNLNDMVKLNESYILNELTFANVLKNRGKANIDLLDLHDDTYESIKRKPKTQMINGHEVVAPRYDAPTNPFNDVYWACPLEKDGFRSCDWASLAMIEREALMINGYYTSKEDVSAFIKALRDNKND